jgi:hypothetical protein
MYQNMTLNPTTISPVRQAQVLPAYEKESYANHIENQPKPGRRCSWTMARRWREHQRHQPDLVAKLSTGVS